MIAKNKEYQIIYTQVSFFNSPALLKRIKKKLPFIEHPFLYSDVISEDHKELFENYLYIEDSPDFPDQFQELVKEVSNIEAVPLGVVSGKDISTPLDMCEKEVFKDIRKGEVFRVAEGGLKNLIVKVDSTNRSEKSATVSYDIMGETRTLDVPFSGLKPVGIDIPKRSEYMDYVKLYESKGIKRAVIIDASWVLYKCMQSSHYAKYYIRDSGKFIGGSLGFYFHLLKIKQVFPEFSVHVVFDETGKRRFKGSGKSMKFWGAYRSNSNWVKKLVCSLGYNLYMYEDIPVCDVVGSISNKLFNTHDRIIINSSDPNYTSLLDSGEPYGDKVCMYTLKKNFRDFSIFDTVETCLERHRVNRLDKVAWLRSLAGEIGFYDPEFSESLVTVFTYNRQKKLGKIPKKINYTDLINESTTVGEFVKELSRYRGFSSFMDKQFPKNLEKMQINCNQLSMSDIRSSGNEFDPDWFEELLEENNFAKEIEMKQKNLRVFRGYW